MINLNQLAGLSRVLPRTPTFDMIVELAATLRFDGVDPSVGAE